MTWTIGFGIHLLHGQNDVLLNSFVSVINMLLICSFICERIVKLETHFHLIAINSGVILISGTIKVFAFVSNISVWTEETYSFTKS